MQKKASSEEVSSAEQAEGESGKQEEETSPQAEEKSDEKEDTTYGDTPLWVILDTMDDVLSLCRHLSGRKIISSRLYKYKEQYYLRLQFAHYKKDITDAIMTLSEFCTLAFTEAQGGYAVAEHGQLILGDGAVEKLAEL